MLSKVPAVATAIRSVLWMSSRGLTSLEGGACGKRMLRGNRAPRWCRAPTFQLQQRRARSALSGAEPREAVTSDPATGTSSSPTASGGADFDSLPCPRGLPVVGTTLSLLLAGSTAQLHRYVDARHAQLGPVFRDTVGPVQAVFVADPFEMRRVFYREGRYPVHLLPDAWMLYNELYGCKRGLFFMDGEEWLRFRRIMNQLMLKNDAAEAFAAPCAMVAEDLVSRWKTQLRDSGGTVEINNLEAELYRWALDVLVAVLLGEKGYREHRTTLNAGNSLQRLADEVQLVFQESARLALLPSRLARSLHLPVWSRFERAVDRALHGASSLVLDLLPLARSGDGLLAKMLAADMELKDVVRIVADLILAAGDTTAYASMWSLYLLASNPEEQTTVAADLDHHSEASPLVRGVMRESLRLYPVAPFLTRLLPEDCEIAGYNVPAGNLILLSLYTSGRSASNFPDPERFWPGRWLRDESTPGSQHPYHGVVNPHASIPFALGARSCVGRKLSESQMSELLNQVLRSFHVELAEPGRDIQMVLRLVSVPSAPIRLRLTPRQ